MRPPSSRAVADGDRPAVRGQHDPRRLAVGLRWRREPALGEGDAAGDRRVAAERHLGQRAEVADAEPPDRARAVRRKERRLRVADLGGDPLHLAVGGQGVADPDARRVAATRVGGERRQPQERASHRVEYVGGRDVGKGTPVDCRA